MSRYKAYIETERKKAVEVSFFYFSLINKINKFLNYTLYDYAHIKIYKNDVLIEEF